MIPWLLPACPAPYLVDEGNPLLHAGVGADGVADGLGIGKHGLKGEHAEAVGGHREREGANVAPHVNEVDVLGSQALLLQGSLQYYAG